MAGYKRPVDTAVTVMVVVAIDAVPINALDSTVIPYSKVGVFRRTAYGMVVEPSYWFDVSYADKAGVFRY
jgi:hypothetical protein